MSKSLTIGYLAREASVNIETVRYYQRIGLLQEPPKPSTGYRIYPPEFIERIKFIKNAQPLGFSLNEIAELLDLGNGHCDDVRLLAEQKRKQIDRQINDLRELRETLDRLILSCQSENTGINERCPFVETLASPQ